MSLRGGRWMNGAEKAITRGRNSVRDPTKRRAPILSSSRDPELPIIRHVRLMDYNAASSWYHLLDAE